VISCPGCGFKWHEAADKHTLVPDEITLRLVNAIVSVSTSLQRSAALMERLEHELGSYDRLAVILDRIEMKLAEQLMDAV
jgi:hypothetical protein